jgi:acyl-CoA thioester hydrolase
MEEYKIAVQLRWSDLDPNSHLRHSVYYDWGALCRIDFLEKYDLNATQMQRLQVVPVSFRESCEFKKEIRPGDTITIDLKLLRSRRDYSRWSMQHTIRKNGEIIAAIITVDGAWIDMARRKLAAPPGEVEKAFNAMPVDENFQWLN